MAAQQRNTALKESANFHMLNDGFGILSKAKECLFSCVQSHEEGCAECVHKLGSVMYFYMVCAYCTLFFVRAHMRLTYQIPTESRFQ